MARLTIASGVRGFVLLDRISEVGPAHLVAHKDFAAAEPFLLLEACAQAAALHARQGCDFAGHAFLLQVVRSTPLGKEPQTGPGRIEARCLARSARSLRYRCALALSGRPWAESELFIGLTDYSARFPREILEPHYRKVFSCLCNG